MIYLTGSTKEEVLDGYTRLINKFGSIIKKESELTKGSDGRYVLIISATDNSESTYEAIAKELQAPAIMTDAEINVENVLNLKKWWQFWK